MAAISSAVNPGNYSDEQKPGKARQSEVEINDFGHCSLLSLTEKEIEQRQCRYDIKTKTAQIGESVEKSLKLIGLGMPQLRGVGNSNGRISPG